MVKSPRWSAVKENKEAPHWVCCTVSIPWQAGENSIYVNELWRHTDAPLSQGVSWTSFEGGKWVLSKPFKVISVLMITTCYSCIQAPFHLWKLAFILSQLMTQKEKGTKFILPGFLTFLSPKYRMIRSSMGSLSGSTLMNKLMDVIVFSSSKLLWGWTSTEDCPLNFMETWTWGRK